MRRGGLIVTSVVVIAGLTALARWVESRFIPWGSSSIEDGVVVLISIDSLRADHLGVYGYSRNTSPEIDAVAAEGVVFEDAISTSSWTLPAHMNRPGNSGDSIS